MENRRKFARIDHQHLVSYTHHDKKDVKDDEGVAKTLNLSVHGLLLLFSRSVEVGTRLELVLNLEGVLVEVVGNVVRCSPDPGNAGMFDVAIELEYVPDRFVESVEQYLSKIATSAL
jgi:hypothetical protein